MRLEVPQPLESGFAGLRAVGIVRHGAPVVDLEAKVGGYRAVVGDFGVVRVTEGVDVHEAEVRDVEESLDLAAGEGRDVEGRAGDLLVAGLVPTRHRRYRRCRRIGDVMRVRQ